MWIVEETWVEMLVSKFTPKQWLHPGVENAACNAKARHRRAAERGMGNEQEVGNRGGERPTERASGEFSAKEGNRRRRHPVSHCHGHELSFSQDRAAQSALVPDHQTESDE